MAELPVNVVVLGDCLEVLRGLPDASVDSVVTDPPAGIAFMGKDWDDPDKWKYPVTKHGFTDGGDRVPAPSIGSASRNPNCRICRRHKRGWKDVPGCECEKPDFDDQEDHLKAREMFISWLTLVMRECLRVLKPGGHMLVWSIPRTSHWTATAIENAGFEVRDCIHHVFGQGFPKSLNISKAIDKAAGAERKVVRPGKGFDPTKNREGQFDSIMPSNVGINTAAFNAKIGEVTEPATEDARKWDGWGTQLKPAVETWWLARKPIEAQNTVSQVLATGTGAINIDGTRIGGGTERKIDSYLSVGDQGCLNRPGETTHSGEPYESRITTEGRYPANLVLSHGLGCERVGTKTVEAPMINRFTDGMKPFGDGAGHPYESSGGGTEEQPVFECAEGCPVRALDEQSGERRSTGDYPSEAVGRDGATSFQPTQGQLYADKGGASRFFANFEPEYDVPFLYTGKASKADKNKDLDDVPPMMELRDDLTEEERAFVLAELRAAGVVP